MKDELTNGIFRPSHVLFIAMVFGETRPWYNGTVLYWKPRCRLFRRLKESCIMATVCRISVCMRYNRDISDTTTQASGINIATTSCLPYELATVGYVSENDNHASANLVYIQAPNLVIFVHANIVGPSGAWPSGGTLVTIWLLQVSFSKFLGLLIIVKFCFCDDVI